MDRPASDFQADKIIGAIIAVLAVLMMLFSLLFLGVGGLIATAASQAKGPVGQNDPAPALFSIPFVFIAFFGLAAGVFQLISGVLVYKSKRVGLILALAVGVLTSANVLGIGIALYAILRLWGNVGPRPLD